MKAIIVDLAVEKGITAESLKKWRQRGRVPHKHRLPFLVAAEKRGVELREQDFEFKATPKRRRAA